MEKKIYKNSFDLKEVYEEAGVEHSIEYAGTVIADWMSTRLKLICRSLAPQSVLSFILRSIGGYDQDGMLVDNF